MKYKRLYAWALLAVLLIGIAMTVYAFTTGQPAWSTRGLAAMLLSGLGTYLLRKRVREYEEAEEKIRSQSSESETKSGINSEIDLNKKSEKKPEDK